MLFRGPKIWNSLPKNVISIYLFHVLKKEPMISLLKLSQFELVISRFRYHLYH